MNTHDEIQVGDLVVVQNATYLEESNGAIGLVIGCLAPRFSMDMHSIYRVLIDAYKVQLSETFQVNVEAHQVRKLADEQPAAVADFEEVET